MRRCRIGWPALSNQASVNAGEIAFTADVRRVEASSGRVMMDCEDSPARWAVKGIPVTVRAGVHVLAEGNDARGR